jgi:uncharacterized protein (DUF433 family)
MGSYDGKENRERPGSHAITNLSGRGPRVQLPQIQIPFERKMKTASGMQREYVEIRNGGYYVAGSRVSLASIVYEYRDGAAAETIGQNFPTLSLEQIHGALAFYLGHREEIEAYLRELEEKWDQLESAAKPADPRLQHKIEEARKRLLAKQA